MDMSLLLEVFVPTFDDGRRDGRGEVGEVATGYPVGEDLILTARHVLEPEDRDPRYAIAVRWHRYPDAGPDRGWFPIHDQDVVWKGEGSLDAAIIRGPRPPELHGKGIVSCKMPRAHTTWLGAAFRGPASSKACAIRCPSKAACI